MTRRGYSCILGVFLTFFLQQCNNEDTGAIFLPDTLDKNYTLVFNDTITVQTSTVLLDSIPSSNRGTILIGGYKDDKLGVVKSTPYFQLIYGSGWTLSDEATYDSIELLMNSSGYYYGDTTKSQTIEVRKILSDLKTSRISKFWTDMGYYSYFNLDANGITNAIYNSASFTVDPPVLGSSTYKPRPKHKDDTIRVKLDYNFGLDFFLKKKQNSLYMKDAYQFVYNYFKGLSINSLENSNVIGIDPTKVKVRIYYKDRSGEKIVRKHFDFLIDTGQGLLYYNNITADRSSTSLASLIPQKEISSILTNDESYIQSGTGVVTKLTFPGLANLRTAPGFKQMSNATLVLEPVKDTYNGFNYLPRPLVLFQTNRSNLPLGILNANYSNNQQSSDLRILNSLSNTINETSSGYAYSFDITQYAQNLIAAKLDFRDVALLLSTSASTSTRDDMLNTITRVSIGNGRRAKYRARILIYYLKQNN